MSKETPVTGWRSVTINDIKADSPNALATGPFGSSISSRFFISEGIPVIRGSNLSEDINIKLSQDGFAFISQDLAHKFQRSIAKANDLIFTCWGTVGQVGLIDENSAYKEYVVSNKQMKLTPNPNQADSRFLYYVFSGPELSGLIRNQAIGSSVPGFNLGQLRSVRFKLPPLGEQRAISKILGALDDKIELNRQMNRTLEGTAQAIFKSWFVDFDPVVAKADGRQPYGMDAETAGLFPDGFEDSELGAIPRSWSTRLMSKVAQVLRSGINPAQNPAVTFAHFSIPAYDQHQVPTLELGAAIKSNKFSVKRGSVLLSKLNPETPRVWLPLLDNAYPAICSTEFLVCEPHAPFSTPYIYCLFNSADFSTDFAGLVTGTSNSHQRVKPDDFANIKMLSPEHRVLERFSNIVGPILSDTMHLKLESQSLMKVRDAILPKLLSGELRVPQAEKVVEAVL